MADDIMLNGIRFQRDDEAGWVVRLAGNRGLVAPVVMMDAALDEIDRLRAAGAALYALLDEMHKCGRRQPGLTEALEGWEAVVAATKEDERG